MKKVKVLYNYSKTKEPSEGFLFEGKKDMSLVDDILNERIDNSDLDSDTDEEKLGYAEKAIFRLSLVKSNISQDNVINHIHPALRMYKKTLFSMLEKDEDVFMNKNGGLCPVEGTLTIIE